MIFGLRNAEVRGSASVEFYQLKTDRARFRAFGAYPVSARLLGILGHQAFQFGFGVLVFDKGLPGVAIDRSEFCPGVRSGHIHGTNRLHLWSRRLNAKEVRGLAGLHAAPELPFGCEQQMLI